MNKVGDRSNTIPSVPVNLQKEAFAPGSRTHLFSDAAASASTDAWISAEAALRRALKGADFHRELTAWKCDDIPSLLAGSAESLHKWAYTFGKAGQHELALHAAQKAVGFYRELADLQPDTDQRPGKFLPHLAEALCNLAYRRGKMGLHKPALCAAEEAVVLFQTLAHQQPDKFRPHLAGSLDNLAIRLGKMGQHECALSVAKKAVALFRELAEQQPDTFQPRLVEACRNLAYMIDKMGRHEPALRATQERRRSFP